MKSHWCAHMKNGRDMSFNRQCRYIDSMDGVMYFMDDQIHQNNFAVIPIDNILWIESVEEEEE